MTLNFDAAKAAWPFKCLARQAYQSINHLA